MALTYDKATRQHLRDLRGHITICIRNLQGTGSFQLNEIVNDLNRLRILLTDVNQNETVLQPLMRRIVDRIDRVSAKVEENKRVHLLEIADYMRPHL